MTNLQKLTKLLCEVQEIKEDIMELRFGTKYYLEWKTIWFYTWYYESRLLSWTDERYTIYEFQYHKKNRALKPLSEIKIIWNPLEERHLRMYCQKKKQSACSSSYNFLHIFNRYWEWQTKNIKIDETKSFDKQSEEVLWALVEYISNLK